MCRLIAVQSARPFDMRPHLSAFARICETSREYQGHGWGLAWLEGDTRRLYKSLTPVWEEDFSKWGETRFMLAHARSAFRDEGIDIKNNMPFFDDSHLFIFNGELRGVRIRERGRIGAEKIFNYIKRFYNGDMRQALEKGTAIIARKTRYVRAMNIMISDMEKLYYSNIYNEDADYFALYRKRTAAWTVHCSRPYAGTSGWERLEKNSTGVWP